MGSFEGLRVSWLMPARDAGAYLAGAVASVLAECDESQELVVVDDGSIDGSVEALGSHPRMRVVRQERLGIVAALETGRAACRARFIARLDADDRALPGRIEAQLACLEESPDVAAVGGRAILFVDEGEPPTGMTRYVAWVNGITDPHREILTESPLFHPAVTFRADAVEGVGGYRDGDFPEDYDLWCRLAAAGYRLTTVDHDVVAIRDHGKRLTRTDPRYRRAGFDACRRRYLAATVLSAPRRVLLWAGARGGRPWLRWLLDAGHDVLAVLDVSSHGRFRHGVPVMDPAEGLSRPADLLLVAVGRWGARDSIRLRIRALRPDLVEGKDWFALL